MSRTLPFLLATFAFVGCGTPERVDVVREPTAAEIDAVCGDEAAAKDELSTAQWKVATLEREAATREGRVRELEARIAKGAENGAAARRELDRLKAELAETREKLAVAEAEKERVLEELYATKEELADTKLVLAQTQTERDEAREDALYNRWQKFVAAAQLEICDKGNRKKLGGCREAVTASLATAARQDRFAHCIRSGQATPAVHARAKEAALPQYAELLGDDVRQVEGWYVEYCDPTLPERDDAPLAEQHLPASSAQQG